MKANAEIKEPQSPRSTRSHLAGLSIFKVTKPRQWQWARKRPRNRITPSHALVYCMAGKWTVARHADKKVLDDSSEDYQSAVQKAAQLGYSSFYYGGKIRKISVD